jgi:hypothetical protein
MPTITPSSTPQTIFAVTESIAADSSVATPSAAPTPTPTPLPAPTTAPAKTEFWIWLRRFFFGG